MGISLTLAELKEYFKIWHNNNFDDFHNNKLETYISSYLSRHGISDKINIIDSLKTGIVQVAMIVSKSIDGNTSLTLSSSLSDAINEINNKNINFNDINLKKLYNTYIQQHDSQIRDLSANKADKSYVDGLISSIESNLGIKPTQIEIQNIPVNNQTNLNTYKTIGIYKSKDAATTQTLSNVPANAQSTAFDLIVLQHMDNGYRQLLLTSNNNNSGNSIYTRNYLSSNNQWSEWYELYGTHNTSPLQMKIEWSEGGSTIYTLLQK